MIIIMRRGFAGRARPFHRRQVKIGAQFDRVMIADDASAIFLLLYEDRVVGVESRVLRGEDEAPARPQQARRRAKQRIDRRDIHQGHRTGHGVESTGAQLQHRRFVGGVNGVVLELQANRSGFALSPAESIPR